MKSSQTFIIGCIGLLFFISSISMIAADYNVPEGQVLIWKFTPEEGNEFYVKISVDSNEYPLNLTAQVYDPYADTLTYHKEFSEIGVNWIYNETVIATLENEYENETVDRIYGNKSVECSRITLDTSNILIVDKATGVVCEATINLGDIVYDLKLIAWEEIDLSAMYSKKPSNPIPGYSIGIIFIAFGSLSLFYSQKYYQK